MPAMAAPPWKSIGGKRVREIFAVRAEASTLLLSVGAWTLLIADRLSATPWRICAAGRADASASLAFAGAASERLVMLVAMMAPLVGFQVRHVVVRSFASRQARGASVFLVGYLAPWLAIAVALIPFVELVTGALGASRAGASACVVAAIWQITASKRRALRRCARTAPLRQDGWRADRACFAYGADTARDCMASCWALMLAAAIRPHDLMLMALVQALATAERYARPRARLTALALLAAGVAVLNT